VASEFALIDTFVAAFAAAGGIVTGGPSGVLALGPGDDAALMRVPAGEYLVATTDTLVAGRHFLPAMPAEAIGWRALAVNLSDLAAMGATPLAILVSFTLPEGDAAWLAACGHGMGELAGLHGVALAGGNMSRGECALGITALGSVPQGEELRRAGGRPGDRVWVSGTIGSAGAGLRLAQARAATAGADWPDLAALRAAMAGPDTPAKALARYLVPAPRCALGRALRGLATAAVDISDGLLADLGHLCAASGVGARIASSRIPLAMGIAARDAVRAGDDYELCFTSSARAVPEVRARAAALGIDVAEIGELVPGSGVLLDDAPVGAGAGYEHF
jgi:thiamine-monophosphate kinase